MLNAAVRGWAASLPGGDGEQGSLSGEDAKHRKGQPADQTPRNYPMLNVVVRKWAASLPGGVASGEQGLDGEQGPLGLCPFRGKDATLGEGQLTDQNPRPTAYLPC